YQLLTGDLNSGPPTGLWVDELEEMGLSRDMVRLLGACVARPEKRPKDAAELAERLAELLAAPPPPKVEEKKPEPPRPAARPAPPPPPTPLPREDRLEAFIRTG